MPYLIGTDEAGYGPNLGPLLITATAWRVEADALEATSPAADLYRLLKAVICRKPPANGRGSRLAIADSKLLYNPAAGIDLLERGVLAVLGLLDCYPSDWHEIWQLLDRDAASYLRGLPWHVDFAAQLPCAADRDDLVRIGRRLRSGLAAAGVELVAIRSRAVFPARFNAATAECGNKAEALSRLTLELVGEVLPSCQGEPVLVVCDKHGGRNRYGRLLQMQFPDPWIETCCESTPESIYRWGANAQRIEFQFRAGGEAFLPAALASMVSKYLRELAMRAFNDFWCRHVPDLKPTAGYPVDSRRFKRAIAARQSELEIADNILWRER